MATTQEISSGSLDDFDADGVADLTRPSDMPFTYNQFISTDIREPVVFSDSSTGGMARFQMDRKGFLSHHSKITFSVVPVDTNTSAYFPLGVGVNSLIDRVVLKSGNGGRVISETQEFGQLKAYDSMFITGEANKERETYLTQRMINHGSVYETDPNTKDTNSDAPEYGIETGREYDGTDLKLLPCSRIDGTSATTKKQSPVYSVLLGDLCDLFKDQDFPLFLCDEDLFLEVHFQSSSKKRVSVKSTQPAFTGSYLIDQSECRMIYDSIEYDPDQMDSFRKKADAKGLTFQYHDYRLTKRTSATPSTWANLIQNVGGAGRFVDKIVVRIGRDDNNKEKTLLNSFYSQHPTTGTTTLNVRYNDRYEFPIDRSNTALLFQTMKTAEGQVPFITRQEYSREMPDTLTARTFEGNQQRSSLGGNLHYLAVKPEREERINNQGIDIELKGTFPAESLTLMCWIALRKVARIKDGRLDCYFA